MKIVFFLNINLKRFINVYLLGAIINLFSNTGWQDSNLKVQTRKSSWTVVALDVNVEITTGRPGDIFAEIANLQWRLEKEVVFWVHQWTSTIDASLEEIVWTVLGRGIHETHYQVAHIFVDARADSKNEAVDIYECAGHVRTKNANGSSHDNSAVYVKF